MEEALSQFVDLIGDPDLDRSASDAVYRALGRGEQRERRSLDALLSAYRLGARVAWRRVAEIAIRARVDRRTLSLLAEAVFAYIDELSALSADGYAEAQSAAAGERDRLRGRLATMLLEPDADEAAIRHAAADADWELPARLAALAWSGDGRRLRRRLPVDTLVVHSADGGAGLALIADPEAPGLRPSLERASQGATAVLGPAVEPLAALRSADRARALRRLIAAGIVSAPDFALADDHLAALVAHGDERALAELATTRLAPLAGETPASRNRLIATLRAWLDHQGEVSRVAAELHVHPQTVRYRLGRLRDLLGDALDHPGTRFELALALRSPVWAPERRESSSQPTESESR